MTNRIVNEFPEEASPVADAVFRAAMDHIEAGGSPENAAWACLIGFMTCASKGTDIELHDWTARLNQAQQNLSAELIERHNKRAAKRFQDMQRKPAEVSA